MTGVLLQAPGRVIILAVAGGVAGMQVRDRPVGIGGVGRRPLCVCFGEGFWSIFLPI